MTWSVEFKQALAEGRYHPRFVLEWVQIPGDTLRVFGGNVRLSSFYTSGYEPLITADGTTYSGGVLSIRDWSCTPLMFEVGVMGDYAVGAGDLRTKLQRGQGVVLKMGFTDDPADFAPIAIGTVYGLSRSGAGWRIRCKGMEGSLASRITTVAGEQSLAWDLGSTQNSTAINAMDTTIDVDDYTVLRRETGGTGAVLVTDDAGGQYYCTYTGVTPGVGTAGTLTGVTVGAFGTTHDATSTGDTVQEVFYVKGHPLEIAAKILASTGTGNNGPYDVLPRSWGYGIPNEHIHERDISEFVALSQPSSGADNWDWVEAAPVEDGQTALNTFLNGAGYFLTQHRGRLTARCVVRPWEDNTPGAFSLTDAMIIPESIRYEMWNPDTPVEYEKCRVLYADGTTAQTSAASDLDHIPAKGVNEHTAGGLYSDTPNAATIAADLVTRLKDWDQRTAEVLYLDLAGWWPAIASPGDKVSLDIEVIKSRTGFDFRGQTGLVTRCAAKWFGARTEVEIVVLPNDESVPWRLPAS